MPENFEKKTQAIPGSSFPPVALYRPMKLFGRTFKVHISTGLTLSPDTVLRTALDLSLLQLPRHYKHPPEDRFKDHPEKVIKDLLRGTTGINKLTSTTQAGVRRLLGQFLPADTLDAALRGVEPPRPIPWQSDWEALLQGLGDPGNDVFYLTAQKLARLDRLAFSAHQLPETDIEAFLEPHIGRPHESWRKYNANLSVAVAVLVDTSLQICFKPVARECLILARSAGLRFGAPSASRSQVNHCKKHPRLSRRCTVSCLATLLCTNA